MLQILACLFLFSGIRGVLGRRCLGNLWSSMELLNSYCTMMASPAWYHQSASLHAPRPQAEDCLFKANQYLTSFISLKRKKKALMLIYTLIRATEFWDKYIFFILVKVIPSFVPIFTIWKSHTFTFIFSVTNRLCIYSWSTTACLQAKGNFFLRRFNQHWPISSRGLATNQLVGGCVAAVVHWWLSSAAWLCVDWPTPPQSPWGPAGVENF